MNRELSLIERALAHISPKAALNRVRARMALDVVLGYEGATKSRRLSGWRTVSGSSANSEMRPAIRTLRDRSRDLARNDEYGTSAIAKIQNNIVGAGIIPVFVSSSKSKSKKLKDLWNEWAEYDVLGDFDENGNIYALQGLIARTMAESGECLAIRRFVKDPRKKIPLEIQVLEADHLDTMKDSYKRSGSEPFDCLGIRFGSTGKRLGYWIYPNHPGDAVSLGNSAFHSSADVIHSFRRDRPGQIRGIPWLAPCILRLKDLSDYEDAQLLRQKIAACYSVFITELEGDKSGAEDTELDRIEPGRIEYLPPGKGVAFASPPGAENYDSYTRQVLHGIAIGTGLTYEMLTGDYSQVNFTSGRMGKSDFWSQLDAWQWQIFQPKVLAPMGRWFLEAAELAGHDVKGVRVDWVFPKRQLVDPTKEIPAITKSIRAGLTSRQQQVRELGYDPEDVEREIQEDNVNADEKGLVFDSDPRRVNNGGQIQADSSASPEEKEGGKE